MKKHAYVTGSKASGYRIVISGDALLSGFGLIEALYFSRYRAAQDLANAIHESTTDYTGRKTPKGSPNHESKR